MGKLSLLWQRLSPDFTLLDREDRLLNSFFYFLVLLCGLLALLGVLTIYPRNIHAQFYFYLIILVSIALAVKGLVNQRPTFSKPKLESIAALVLISTGLFLRLFHLETHSFWFDEYHQFKIIRDLTQKDIFHTGAFEIQLPYYYALQYGMQYLFGESVLVSRLPSAIAGGASLAVVYLGLKGLGAGPIASLLGLFYLSFHPFHLYKSLVARPYALAGLWLCFFVYYFLKSVRHQSYNHLTGLALILGMMTLSFHVSILCLTLFLFFLLRRLVYKTRDFQYFSGVTIGFLILLPLNLFLFRFSLEEHWKHFGNFITLERFDLILEALKNVNFVNVVITTTNIKILGIDLYFLLLILILAAFFLLKKKTILSEATPLQWLLALMIGYPLLFIAIYFSVSKQIYLPLRFAIAPLMLTPFFAGLLYHAVEKLFKKHHQKFAHLALAIAILAASPRLFHYVWHSPSPYKRPHWQSLYEILNQYPQSAARVLSGTYNSFVPGFVGRSIYLDNADSLQLLTKEIPYGHYPDLRVDKEALKVHSPYVLVFSDFWMNETTGLPGLDQLELEYVEYSSPENSHLHIFRIENNEQLYTSLKGLFEHLYQNATHPRQKKMMLLYLVLYSLHFGPEQEALAYQTLWHEVGNPEDLQNFINP